MANLEVAAMVADVGSSPAYLNRAEHATVMQPVCSRSDASVHRVERGTDCGAMDSFRW